jgi:hypothetical protein
LCLACGQGIRVCFLLFLGLFFSKKYMAFLWQSVTVEPGSENMSGMFGELLVAPISWIDNIPARNSQGVISGDITLKPGKKFIPAYHTQGTGEIKWVRQGERDGGSVKASCEWNTPGNKQDNMTFMDNTLNGGFVIIGYDSEGVRRVMAMFVADGDVKHFAYQESAEGTTGKEATAKRGIQYMFSADLPKTPPKYTGDVSGLVLAPPYALAATSVSTTSATTNWEAVTDATAYALDVSTDENFGSYVGSYNNLNVAGLTQALSGLTSGVTYYYRVRAKIGTEIVSGDSNVRTFTTT